MAHSLRRRLAATASFSFLSVMLVPFLAHTACAGGALPSGGQYVAGKGTIAGNGASLTVRQSSTTGIIDWNSFSIGKSGSVTIDNGAGATLNEVTGGALSTIAGSLHASGSLYLINEDGIIVSGRVVTGGNFVASTEGPDGKQHGNILDAGSIRAAHGAVRLSAVNVSVPGRIVVERGGQLWLTSAGTTAVSGTLNADNARGDGGTIVATGKTVDIAGTANIRASGKAGGTVLIGGDVHGGAITRDNFVKADVADAQTTIVAKGAQIFADGITREGGNIVIWSDGHTSYDGALSAKGQTAGGFAEVSSHNWLGFGGRTDLSSALGQAGTLLLDPYDVTISTAANSNTACKSGVCWAKGDDSVLNVTTLEDALATGNVTVTTGKKGTESGGIAVAAAIGWSSSHELKLDAAGAIVIGAAIRASRATLDLESGSTITSDNAGILEVDTLTGDSKGEVTLNAANEINDLGAFSTHDSELTLVDASTLTVDGKISSGRGLGLSTTGKGHNLAIDAELVGIGVGLNSAGTIASSTAGVIKTQRLTGSSDGSTTLTAANAIGTVDGFSTDNGAFYLTDTGELQIVQVLNAGTGEVTLSTTHEFVLIESAITGGTVNLTDTASYIQEQTGGSITASLLNASAATGIDLASTTNDITTVGIDRTTKGKNIIVQH